MNLAEKPTKSKIHLPILKQVDRLFSKLHETKKSSLVKIQLKPLEKIADEIENKLTHKTPPQIRIKMQTFFIDEKIAKSGKVH